MGLREIINNNYLAKAINGSSLGRAFEEAVERYQGSMEYASTREKVLLGAGVVFIIPYATMGILREERSPEPVRLPLVPEHQHHFMPRNCYEGHSDNEAAKAYHRRGLAALHRGDTQTALGLFRLASDRDPGFFCSREGISATADLLDEDEVGGAERYANSNSGNPLTNRPHPSRNGGNPDYVCHLLHPGFFKEQELDELGKRR